MKQFNILPFLLAILPFTGTKAYAECVLSVSGGFNEQATMGYYFSDLKLKEGWVAKWDPNKTGDASLVFNQDEWNDRFFGFNVVSSAKLKFSSTQIKIRASGFGYLSPKAGCGQPALSEGYSKSIPRFQKKLLKALPNCL